MVPIERHSLWRDFRRKESKYDAIFGERNLRNCGIKILTHRILSFLFSKIPISCHTPSFRACHMSLFFFGGWEPPQSSQFASNHGSKSISCHRQERMFVPNHPRVWLLLPSTRSSAVLIEFPRSKSWVDCCVFLYFWLCWIIKCIVCSLPWWAAIKRSRPPYPHTPPRPSLLCTFVYSFFCSNFLASSSMEVGHSHSKSNSKSESAICSAERRRQRPRFFPCNGPLATPSRIFLPISPAFRGATTAMTTSRPRQRTSRHNDIDEDAHTDAPVAKEMMETTPKHNRHPQTKPNPVLCDIRCRETMFGCFANVQLGRHGGG